MAAVARQRKATAPPPLFNYPTIQFHPTFSPSNYPTVKFDPTFSVEKKTQKPRKLRRVSDGDKNTQKPRQHRDVTDYIKIEPLHNPEAITAYHYYDSKKHPNVDSKDLINNAKKHLSSIGWSFYNIQKTVDRKEIRYESPSGRVYISLKAACKAFIPGLPIVTGPLKPARKPFLPGLPIVIGLFHDPYKSVPESLRESRKKDEVQGVNAVQFLARYAHFRIFHTFAFIIWLLNT